MPHKSFTSPTGGEPLTFDLNGQTFHCIPRLPAGVSLDAAMVATGPDAARRLGEFFDAVLAPEEAEDFARMIRAVDPPEAVVPMDLVNEIVQWLVTEYTARPTGRPSASGNGRPSTAPSSTDAASSQG